MCVGTCMYDIYVCMFMYVSAGTHVKVRITLVSVLAFYLAWDRSLFVHYFTFYRHIPPQEALHRLWGFELRYSYGKYFIHWTFSLATFKFLLGQDILQAQLALNLLYYWEWPYAPCPPATIATLFQCQVVLSLIWIWKDYLCNSSVTSPHFTLMSCDLYVSHSDMITLS